MVALRIERELTSPYAHQLKQNIEDNTKLPTFFSWLPHAQQIVFLILYFSCINQLVLVLRALTVQRHWQ